MLSENDVQETEIAEKYIFQQKTKTEEEFWRVHWYVTFITSLRGQVTHHWHSFKLQGK